MKPSAETKREADLVARFAKGYRKQLSEIISTLNRSLANGLVETRQQESMRCCLEAVDLVLSSHEQFARLIGSLAVQTVQA